jgi:hypothetical protein
MNTDDDAHGAKRIRLTDAFDQRGSETTSLSSGFNFGFDLGPDAAAEEEKADAPLPEVTVSIPVPHTYAVILRDVSAIGGIRASRGDIVKVNWLKSSHFELHVAICDSNLNETSTEGLLSTDILKMLPYETEASPARPNVIEVDTVFEAPSAATPSPHYCPTPLAVELGLQPLVWPLTSQAFLRDVYQRKALVVHGTGERLSQLQGDLHGLDVEKLIASASRSVIWMKTRAGKMQYIEAAPEVSLSAYQAGHTLYFNPDHDTQARYVGALCADLGVNFGAEKELQGCGGDMEVFAVSAPHHTPWHFDSQENFSVQLVGLKKWTIVPGARDVVSNLHAGSTNRASVNSDLKLHAAAGDASVAQCLDVDGTAPVPDLDSHPLKQEFIVRPGTVFYHPAGFWHKVEALDEAGSLSINLSLDTMRWYELVVSRLTQLLFQHRAMRRRIHIAPSNPLADMQRLLAGLPGLVSQLRAQDFIPPALLMEHRAPDLEQRRYKAVPFPAHVHSLFVAHQHDMRAKYPITDSSAPLQFNPLATLTRSEPAYITKAAKPAPMSFLTPLPVAAAPSTPASAPRDAASFADQFVAISVPLTRERAQAWWTGYLVHSGYGNEAFSSMSCTAVGIDLDQSYELLAGVAVADGGTLPERCLLQGWAQMFAMEALIHERSVRAPISDDVTQPQLLIESRYSVETLACSTLKALKTQLSHVAEENKLTLTISDDTLMDSIRKSLRRLVSLLVHVGVLRCPQ